MQLWLHSHRIAHLEQSLQYFSPCLGSEDGLCMRACFDNLCNYCNAALHNCWCARGRSA